MIGDARNTDWLFSEIVPPAHRLRICGTERKSVQIKPGEKREWQIKSPGIIRNMWFSIFAQGKRLKSDSPMSTEPSIRALRENPDFYRNVRMQIYFDESKDPQVNAPIADYFLFGGGTVQNIRSQFIDTIRVPPIDSAPGQGSFNSRFPMPFERGCIVSFENMNSVTMNIEGVISWSERIQSHEVLRFHAAYNEGRCQNEPLMFANIEGQRGNFLGLGLHIENDEFNHRWHEAPEHFLVDGETTLSGTGGEVYFGSCWGFRQNWSSPHMGVTLVEPKGGDVFDQDRRFNTAGRFSAYRFHPHDLISFRRSLRGYFAKDSVHDLPKEQICVSYRSVAFWYGTKS